ncbi:MAG: hypothetical protein LBS65_06570, partial [Desulfovibrio sp.]|nr:hypothetical protein [Desulfovibrio sp.]
TKTAQKVAFSNHLEVFGTPNGTPKSSSVHFIRSRAGAWWIMGPNTVLHINVEWASVASRGSQSSFKGKL